jgi:hypothetical protein
MKKREDKEMQEGLRRGGNMNSTEDDERAKYLQQKEKKKITFHSSNIQPYHSQQFDPRICSISHFTQSEI